MREEFELSRRQALTGLAAIGAAGAGAGLGTSAYFSDDESFENNVITAGELDLSVNYYSFWDQGMAGSGSVSGTANGDAVSADLSDVKPGDSGLLAFCPQIETNPAYLWVLGELTDSRENGYAEPEPEDENGEGELEENVEITVSYCTVSDDVGDDFEPADTETVTEIWSGTLAEFLVRSQGGLALDGGVEASEGPVGFPEPGEQACFAGTADEAENDCLCIDWEVPTSVGNEIQGDSLAFDLQFYAQQCRNNSGTNNPVGIEVHRNLTFAERPSVGSGSHVEGELRLDLYLPTGGSSQGSPVIVFMHGGMWLGGAKDNETYLFEDLARQGFAVASIEYRFIEEGTFPAQIHDVNAAIRWLRAHAGEYNLDPNNVGTLGTSSGGHLAALAGVTNEVEEFTGDGPRSEYSSEVQAGGSWFGLMSLDQMAETAPPDGLPLPFEYEGPDSPESELVGETIADNPEAGKYASPVEYLDPDDPPLMLIHGKDDRLVGYGQSELMYEEALDQCHDTKLYLLDGLGHSSDNVYSALTSYPPAEGTFRAVDCSPTDDQSQERSENGPVASFTDLVRFYRRALS